VLERTETVTPSIVIPLAPANAAGVPLSITE
jgi:hypothetical protein